MTVYACCTQNRGEAIRASALSNGIDFIEVVDGPAVPDADRQRILHVHLINPPSPPSFSRSILATSSSTEECGWSASA